MYSYLERTQIAADESDREKYFRHRSKGGWPFSTAAHGFEPMHSILCALHAHARDDDDDDDDDDAFQTGPLLQVAHHGLHF